MPGAPSWLPESKLIPALGRMLPLISLNDITVQVGTETWFAHTTWTVEKGQNWAVVGDTGSGQNHPDESPVPQAAPGRRADPVLF